MGWVGGDVTVLHRTAAAACDISVCACVCVCVCARAKVYIIYRCNKRRVTKRCHYTRTRD
jgi:hypothetical protein